MLISKIYKFVCSLLISPELPAKNHRFFYVFGRGSKIGSYQPITSELLKTVKFKVEFLPYTFALHRINQRDLDFLLILAQEI